MKRSGAITLAAVLMLGAVTGGQGQELSSSVTPANGPPFGAFLLCLRFRRTGLICRSS